MTASLCVANGSLCAAGVNRPPGKSPLSSAASAFIAFAKPRAVSRYPGGYVTTPIALRHTMLNSE